MSATPSLGWALSESSNSLMKHLLALVSLSLVACTPAYSAPVQRMADAQAAYRSAQESGAEQDPKAMLHLNLSEAQFAEGKTLLDQEKYRRADFLFIRSKADAELALAMAQEHKTKLDAEEAASRAREKSKQSGPTPVTGDIQQ